MGLPEGHSGYTEKFERRERGRRYRISAAVAFAWQSPSGELRQASGISRNISGHGISVISSSIPIPGSPIEVTVNLPVPWARTAMLRGRGVVLRLHPEMGQPWGFAATIEFDEEVGDGEAQGSASSDPFAAMMGAPRTISETQSDQVTSRSGIEIDKLKLWGLKSGQA